MVYCVVEFSNGDRYEGQYKEGKRHGQGVSEHSNGTDMKDNTKKVKDMVRGVFEFSNSCGQYKKKVKNMVMASLSFPMETDMKSRL